MRKEKNRKGTNSPGIACVGLPPTRRSNHLVSIQWRLTSRSRYQYPRCRSTRPPKVLCDSARPRSSRRSSRGRCNWRYSPRSNRSLTWGCWKASSSSCSTKGCSQSREHRSYSPFFVASAWYGPSPFSPCNKNVPRFATIHSIDLCSFEPCSYDPCSFWSCSFTVFISSPLFKTF